MVTTPNRRPTLCLNMIVKNEARIIERCLASVRPLIDTWVIVDTGSSDGTQEVIRRVLAGLPGELHERPWVDFGTNRSEALALASGKADYIFVMDADDELVIPAGWQRPALEHDLYYLRLTQQGNSMDRAQLLRAALPWRYEGVLHEVVTCDRDDVRRARLPGIHVRMHSDSARTANPNKYLDDARTLEAALAAEPDNARYAFYLAQSYRDAKRPEQAMAAYERRAAMGGFAEEVWSSLLSVAQLREQLGRPPEEVIAAYLAAHESRPRRAESLCYLACYCRMQSRPAAAYVFARAAAEIPRPKDLLQLDEVVYACRARDELMMAAHLTGRGPEAGALAAELLAGGKLPPAARARVERIRGLYA